MRGGSKTAVRALACAALVIALAAPDAAGAAGGLSGPVQIVYRPSPGRVDYTVRQVDRLSDTQEKEPPRWQVSEILQHTGQEVVAGEKGLLLVKGQVLGESVFSSEDANAKPAPLTEPRMFHYQISPQGGFAREPDASDATAVMLPVFAERPMKPGETWEIERPVAPGVYVPLMVKHEFLKVDVVDGVPCAIIVSQAQAKESSTDGRTGCAMKGSARTAVSLSDGQLVSFEAFTALALKTAPLSTEPPRVMRRETLRSVVRQKPEPAETR